MRDLLFNPASDQQGIVTVFVTVIITVLFGFAALAVDVARLYEERRQLQTTADVATISGSTLLWRGDSKPCPPPIQTVNEPGVSCAASLAKHYVTMNPTTHHPGPYSEIAGDLVSDKYLGDGEGCVASATQTIIPSGTYDCLTTKVVAPSFEYSFGKVLGFDDRALSATATAYIGNGAPSGPTIFPWVLRDCPNPAQYPDEASVSVASCPYRFSDSYNGTRTTFNPGPNFAGLQIPHGASPTSGDCPSVLMDGYFDADGGNSTYSAVMEGQNPAFWPCALAPGQRMDTRGGNLGVTLKNALEARGASTTTCMNETNFNSSFAKAGDGDGFVTILDKDNPCLIIVAFGVHAQDNASTRANLSMTPTAAQKSVAAGRFANFSGSNQFLVIRRLAYYYITNIVGGTNGDPQGVYLRAIDTDATMVGPMDKCPAGVPISECAHHSVFVVKLAD